MLKPAGSGPGSTGMARVAITWKRRILLPGRELLGQTR